MTMKPVYMRALALGAGRPKICVPLTGATLGELAAEIMAAKASRADFVEWRADYFDAGMRAAGTGGYHAAARELRGMLGGMPLLFTFRTLEEGGQKPAVSSEGSSGVGDGNAAGANLGFYETLVCEIAASGAVDAVDIEARVGGGIARHAIGAARRAGVTSIVSSHDFHAAPSKDEALERLRAMRALGCDVPKLAAMAYTFSDALALMAATDEFTREAGCPAITMSMGQAGRITRCAGQLFGSAVTFGALGQTTAPGQLPVADLALALDILGG